MTENFEVGEAAARAPLQQLVDEQAEDEGLWLLSPTASEKYLQIALRRLHAAIEGAPRAPRMEQQRYENAQCITCGRDLDAPATQAEAEAARAPREPLEPQLRAAWEAGFKLCLGYGDNAGHFHGEQKERQWQAFMAAARSALPPPQADEACPECGRPAIECERQPCYFVPRVPEPDRIEKVGRQIDALKVKYEHVDGPMFDDLDDLETLLDRLRAARAGAEAPSQLIAGLRAFAADLARYQDTYADECALITQAADALEGK
jgi:hypothetical protein